MERIDILKASLQDSQLLCDMFFNHISVHPEYISHGEIQMGVGEGRCVDGRFVTSVAADAHHRWLEYIDRHLSDNDSGIVYKAVDADGGLAGFCVAEISNDGDKRFGVLCDILVSGALRGRGVGSALLQAARDWFSAKGISDIYLESGLNNHEAHEYFIGKGFMKVSEIYKLV